MFEVDDIMELTGDSREKYVVTSVDEGTKTYTVRYISYSGVVNEHEHLMSFTSSALVHTGTKLTGVKKSAPEAERKSAQEAVVSLTHRLMELTTEKVKLHYAGDEAGLEENERLCKEIIRGIVVLQKYEEGEVNV
jgi:hypothetical protein